MNASIQDPSHPSLYYYDSDYPSKDDSLYPENFDDVVAIQGIANDVGKYIALTRQYGKKVLELCCGTGRISIPLVKSGCTVTAVDISSELIRQFKNKTDTMTDFPRHNLTVAKMDVTCLSLPETDFDIIICAFNSLLCISDFILQQQTLQHAASHLKPGGLLVIDIVNPLITDIFGKEPEPFFTRRNRNNGNWYTRFAATEPLDINQCQTVYGWYDETTPEGIINRKAYHLKWRLLFRYEIQLMLEKAGFSILKISGGNNDEPLHANSLKMFIEAIRS